MEEVSGPVVGIALILAAVFIPVGVHERHPGRLNQQFALTIAISVLISAFNALTLSPALAAMLLRPRNAARGSLGAVLRRVQPRLRREPRTATSSVSRALIRKAVDRHRCCSLASSSLAGGLGRRAADQLRARGGLRLLPAQRRSCRRAASLQRTDAVCRKVDAILREDRGRRRLQHDRRLQPAHARDGAATTASTSSASSRGTSAQRTGWTRGRSSTGSTRRFRADDPRGDRRSRSCRRRFPASARRAASRSGCRIAAAATIDDPRQQRCRSSSPRRASGPSWPASTRRSAPRCRRSSSTSTTTRC